MGLTPALARRFGVPMRVVEPEPWALGMRFRNEPHGLHRHVVAAGSPADGTAIGDLNIGEHAWISMVNRRGHLLQVRGHTILETGDEVLALADPGTDLRPLFDSPQATTGIRTPVTGRTLMSSTDPGLGRETSGCR